MALAPHRRSVRHVSTGRDPDSDGTRFVLDLRFPGQRYDAATGLHYNYYRDYDPATGRYVQVDPIGLAGGLNPYLYANGSPLKFIDPSGEVAWLAPLIPIAIGALSSAVGDAVVQGIGIYRSDGCKKFNWRQLGISTIGGAIGGRFLPGASFSYGLKGVAGLGAAVNTGVYFANGDTYDASGVAWAAGSGLVGGVAGGAFQRRFPYGVGGTAANSEMVRKSNEAANIRLNTGISSLTRSAASGLPPSVPMPSGSESQPCGCSE
ncbi:RHS repeat-associated core domain-containing protein [Luteibacter flocculans]|uniref:RHS repeat-associated core domain-containing protein n=1 Tax=Luteibacter flocculans TaxID=2780091 RepID=A0ABY4TCE2_9GAMM|nr:RHS repeat-associated core domain-containing protein [Luteibacter flocculans]